MAFCLKMPISFDCPIYCGKVFPHIMGKLSQAVGNLFPQYVGLIHCIWKQTKGVHGSIDVMLVSSTLHYDKYPETLMRIWEMKIKKLGSSSNLVINSLSLYFQVTNYPFLLTFIRKYRHWLNELNERRKTYHQIWRRTLKSIKTSATCNETHVIY